MSGYFPKPPSLEGLERFRECHGFVLANYTELASVRAQAERVCVTLFLLVPESHFIVYLFAEPACFSHQVSHVALQRSQ